MLARCRFETEVQSATSKVGGKVTLVEVQGNANSFDVKIWIRNQGLNATGELPKLFDESLVAL